MPEGVTVINTNAFYNCGKLETIVFPDSLNEVYGNAFTACLSLKEVTIPKNVSVISASAFLGVVENIWVDEENQSFVSVDGILYSKDMTSLYTIPGKKDLTNYVIPSSVKTLEKYAFYTQPITEIVIPDSVETIWNDAFRLCSNLKKAVVPASVTFIGNGAFLGCGNDFVMYGYEGSTAQQYAADNEIKFKVIENELEYSIQSVKLYDEKGNELSRVSADTSFVAEMSVVKGTERTERDCFIIAVYDTQGTLVRMGYVKEKIPVNEEFQIGIQFGAQNCEIGSVCAMVWDGFSTMNALALKYNVNNQ